MNFARNSRRYNGKIYFNVYDRDLNFLGVIDSFSSLRWRRKFFETGEFELSINPTANNFKLLNYDNIIVRSDLSEDDEFGIIESWKVKDDGKKVSISVYGSFGLSLLKRRLIKTRINFSGTYIKGFRKLLNTMTPFSKLDIVDSDIESESIRYQCTYKNVYTYHTKLSKASGIGGKITLDIKNKRFKYVNYVGKDRTEDQRINTRYEFSEDMRNLNASEYTYSRTGLINDVLVAGIGEGIDRITREISTIDSTTHDFDIRETYVDAKNESNEDLTDAEYNEVLDNLGKQQLADPIENFEATVHSVDYRTRWDLGDIVGAKKESWGIIIKQRITEVEEVIERGKYTVTPVFGTPIAETLEDEEED